MNIYLVSIGDQYPNFYVFAKDQQSVIGAVNVYLSNNDYQNVPTSTSWSVELINEAYTNDDSIILSANA